jgi:two-component system phosphate regulon sensor histidine kinase PhoR
MGFRHIRWRIAVFYAMLILILAGATWLFGTRYVRSVYLNQLEERMASEARLLADHLRAGITAGVLESDLDAEADRLAALLDARVTVVTASGLVLSDSDRAVDELGSHFARPEIQEALAHGRGRSMRFSNTLGEELLYVAVAVPDGDARVGVVRLARPLSEVSAEVRALRNRIVLGIVIATALALALALWIAERTARPVRVLTRTVQDLAAGDLDARLIPTTRDEVGTLTSAFNDMADQLKSMVGTVTSERQRLSAVLENMGDGVVIVDGAGIVQLVNSAAERMLGISGASVNRSLAQLTRHHEVVSLWQRCRADGQEQAGIVQVDRPGTALQVIVTPMGDQASPSYLLMLQDLTRLRQLETMRRDLTSNMSHELRTPITSLKVLAETLRDGALDDPPAARRFVERINTEVDAIAQMVDELLELTRIESGQAPVQLAPATVAEIVLPVIERLGEQAQRAGLELRAELPEDLPQVLADLPRIQQALTNLAHNAVKFTPPGGSVVVAAKAQENQVLFSVRDTGIGIPPEMLTRIFERFYRADRARTGQGTGLGLAIAKHLVQAHGGHIWAASREGVGSTFFFTLPVA